MIRAPVPCIGPSCSLRGPNRCRSAVNPLHGLSRGGWATHSCVRVACCREYWQGHTTFLADGRDALCLSATAQVRLHQSPGRSQQVFSS